MPDLFDYLDWRGDLTFEDYPVCEVDNLVFCLLSYVNLDGILPTKSTQDPMTIHQAAAEYFFNRGEEEERPLGLIVPSDILTLFRRLAHTPRFRDLELTGYVNEICEKREMQFSALTVRLPMEQVFVTFRGTDDSLVGWREDFNLSHMEEVPSQRMAAEYLNSLDLTPDTKLYVAGHSKGGNLAVWGAVHAKPEVRRHIIRIYSNDGPGFSERMLTSEAYRELSNRICKILPEDSLVGLLLEHDGNYTIVKSNRRGLYQHDGLSWEVMGAEFLRAESLSAKGFRHDTVVRERIDAMTREERKKFTSLMFTLLEATGAKTLTDLHRGGTKTLITMIKAFRELTEEEQETASYLWDKLFTGRSEEKEKNEVSLSDEKVPPTVKKGGKKPRGRIRISFFPLFRP